MQQHIQQWLKKPWVVAALIVYLVFVVWVYSLIIDRIKHWNDLPPQLTYEQEKQLAYKALPSPCNDCDFRLVHVEPPSKFITDFRFFVFTSPKYVRRTIKVMNSDLHYAELWHGNEIFRFDPNAGDPGLDAALRGDWTNDHYDPLSSTQTGRPAK